MTSVSTSLRSRFQVGAFWSIAGALATSGFTFIINITLARLLGREGFGQFGMVQSTVAAAAGIGQLATGYTATKFVAEFRGTDPGRAGRIIGLCSVVSALSGSIAALVLILGAPLLAKSLLAAPSLTLALRLAGGIVFFTILTGYQMGSLAGLESYRLLAALAGFAGLANVVAASIGSWWWGLNGAVAGLAIGAGVQWLILRQAMTADCERQGIQVTRGKLIEERSVFFSFALPAALGGLSSLPALWLGNAFLVRQTDGFVQLGLYTAAFTLRSLVFFLPNLLNRVSMSLLNNQKGLRNREAYRRVYTTNLVATGVSVVAAAAFVALAGVPILRMFGKDFTAGFPVLLVLLLSAIVETLTGSLYQVVQAESRMWSSMFIIMLPRDITLVVLSYILTPRLGALGLATAYTIAWTLACISTAVLVARIGITSNWRDKLAGEGA